MNLKSKVFLIYRLVGVLNMTTKKYIIFLNNIHELIEKQGINIMTKIFEGSKLAKKIYNLK
jgi:H2-forming N5,N10-methylenetetrahydromethanopterin dehydrogenase-like enzyme